MTISSRDQRLCRSGPVNWLTRVVPKVAEVRLVNDRRAGTPTTGCPRRCWLGAFPDRENLRLGGWPSPHPPGARWALDGLRGSAGRVVVVCLQPGYSGALLNCGSGFIHEQRRTAERGGGAQGKFSGEHRGDAQPTEGLALVFCVFHLQAKTAALPPLAYSVENLQGHPNTRLDRSSRYCPEIAEPAPANAVPARRTARKSRTNMARVSRGQHTIFRSA